MKKLILILLVTVTSYAQDNDNVKSILLNYERSTKNIYRIEYNAQRIDTFASGEVWNRKGFAFIEREKTDKLFGFYFAGERFDINEMDIYDGKNEFWVYKNKKSYKIEKPGIGFLGSPGGQIIAKELLFPDTTYKDVKLINVTKAAYILEYQFKDDTTYNITNDKKVIELSKNNFLPLKITSSYIWNGNKASSQIIINNLQINSNVNSSIEEFKKTLSNYNLIKDKINRSEDMVGSKAPKFILPKLFNTTDKIGLTRDKLTLLDFWEVWCAPCIVSLPKVEKIYKKFIDKVRVIGIITENISNARKLVNKKNITYTNLIGNKNLIKKYRINSYPRYYLVGKDGIIKKEYYEFSNQIEIDILKYLNE